MHIYLKTECLQSESKHCLGGKGKDRVSLIKSLINIRDRSSAWGAHYKRYKRIGPSYQKV